MRYSTCQTCLTRTTRPPMVLLLLLAAAACADEPTRAPGAAPIAGAAAPVARLSATAEERGGLRAALQFTREQSRHALRERAAADKVNAALERLVERLEADDRAGVVRAVAAARAALHHYRELAGDEASAAELGAIEIAIDRAESFTRDAGRDSVTAAPPAATAPATPSSRQER